MTLTPSSVLLLESQMRRASVLKSALEPVLPFLKDDQVIEIMLNADGQLWVERAGVGMQLAGVAIRHQDAERMLRVIAGELHLELNAETPTLAAKIPLWGARVQASIPPIVEAPVFALRKPASFVFTLADYVNTGMLDAGHAEALVDAVCKRKNILIGGGTGSGKTTFANALLHVVSESTQDRIYIIEDTPELRCTAQNRLQVFVQPPLYSWQRAVVDAMRYRPDRIVVGEVRDGCALELIKAWNTGHPGGLATIHANDTRGMLERLCQLIEEVVPTAPRAMIAQTVDVCVHLQRDPRHPAGRSVSAVDRVVECDKHGQFRLEPLAVGR
jgi:P-type conjugative transfer ATPase TrbB